MNSKAPATKAVLRLLPLLIALSACRQVIEPDLPEHTPRLVLQAFFTSDGSWPAKVGGSVGILQPLAYEETSVADAEVELVAGDRIVGELKFHEGARVYVFEDSSLQAGETYSLQVSAPGFETIRATDTVPRPVPTFILSYVVNDSSHFEESLSGDAWIRVDLSIKLEIQDPPGQANYYQIRTFRSVSTVEYISTEESILKIKKQEGSISTKDPSIMADNNNIEGFPFEEEGTFSGRAPYFRDTLFDGRNHEIELSCRFVEPEGKPFFLQVLYISETFYDHLQNARLHEYIRENPFAEPLNVYGNVENGYGIFAGYSSRTFELTLDEEWSQPEDHTWVVVEEQPR